MSPIESVESRPTGGPRIDYLHEQSRRPVFRLDFGFDDGCRLEIRHGSFIDGYDVRPLTNIPSGTSLMYSILGPVGVALPANLHWNNSDTWLPELEPCTWRRTDESSDPRPLGPVSLQLSDVHRITGLSDERIAAIFPGGVTRETVNRWRNRPSPNMRPANVYRLGTLHQLATRMEDAGIDARVWLSQPVLGASDTPYDLICHGRIGDVLQAVEEVAAGLTAPNLPMRTSVVDHGFDTIVSPDDGEWAPDLLDEDE